VKLIWVGALLLLFASVASLISNRESGRLIDESWTSASKVLPNTTVSELERSTPTYAAWIFAQFPEPFREKFAAKIWQALELIIFRSQLLWHLIPALLVSLIVGSLEGWWARANQKALVRMHSPMRFSLALAGLGFIPVMSLLWIVAPMTVPAILVFFTLGAVAIISARNLIVHAPTQF
jgi:Domain of unknown function (DUF4400)